MNVLYTLGARIVLICALLVPTTVAANDREIDQVRLITWPIVDYFLPIYYARETGIFDQHDIALEETSVLRLSHFQSAYDESRPGSPVVLGHDVTHVLAMVQQSQEHDQALPVQIVDFTGSSTLEFYLRNDVALSDARSGVVRVGISRCGWRNRELKSDDFDFASNEVPALAEAFSYLAATMVRWLHTNHPEIRVWCGEEPESEFEGVWLVPIMGSSSRDRALETGDIDGFVNQAARSRYRSLDGGDLTLVAAAQELLQSPEGAVAAAVSDLEDPDRSDVVRRAVQALKEAKKQLHDMSDDELKSWLFRLAEYADAQPVGSVIGDLDAGVADALIRLRQLWTGDQDYDAKLQQAIAFHGWRLEVEALRYTFD